VKKCNKGTQTVPNGHKISQMPLGIKTQITIKYINFFPIYVRPSKIYPNWDFGFENKPPGNPALVP
jgi:hypothetical protein